jgi:hypothetical protein
MQRPSRAGVLVTAVASALLLAHAASYDFFCDDAFIPLRYAENLAAHGAPVYNLGERVEGYTSFLWMALAAVGAALGQGLTRFVQGLGALSGVGLLSATWLLWARLCPRAPFGGAIVVLAVAASAPVAAWTLGGLETPLFAALVTLGLVAGAELSSRAFPDIGWRPPRFALGLGLLLFLTTLTRPEGALLALLVFVVALAFQRGRPAGQRAALWFAASYGALLVAFVAWRWWYYGYPLPNTYYLKSSGDPALLRERGLGYVGLAATELGVAFVAALGLALFVPSGSAEVEDLERRRSRAVAWLGRALIALFVPYVISVGGDFLDLYRFFVPLLPIAFALVVSAGYTLLRPSARPRAVRCAAALGAVALLGAFAAGQLRLRETALKVAEPERARIGVEPLGWTRLYALKWAAIGRWIASVSAPDDWLAVGAAGAMPYHARVNNLDTFGLCDAYVAHEAPIVGNRPGHQRFAPLPYILSKSPVFLFIGNDYARDVREPVLRRDPAWERRGYVWAEATIDAETFGAPTTFYQYFLLRRDRAEALRGRALVRTALP